MNIVQVGTHDADDDLYEMVVNLDPKDIKNLVLVEPQEQFNDDISNRYKNYDFKIENILIHYDDVDNDSFYFTDQTRVSSIIPNHLRKHNQYNFQVVNKKCMTLNKLFEKYQMSNIDVLFIDAEGIDDKLIYSIDFEKYNISEIYYENLHIDNNAVENFLIQKKYKVTKNVLFNGWTNVAKKNI